MHYLALNIYYTEVGIAVEDKLCIISSESELQRFYTGNESIIRHIESSITKHHLDIRKNWNSFNYHGVDIKSFQLVWKYYEITFYNNGFKKFSEMANFETKYKDNMIKDEFIE